MRNRQLALLVSVAMLFSLCACADGSQVWVPEKATAEIEPYARRAIEIIDGYLNFTITADEATGLFQELYERMDPFEIRSIDSEYCEADKTVAYIVDMLAIWDAKHRSDEEYRMYRDLLAFQIGEPVSGKAYPADQSSIDSDKPLDVLIDVDSTPFDFGNIYVSQETWSVMLMFDRLNGVHVPDLGQYVEEVLHNLSDNNVAEAILYVEYSCYDQSVLYIYITILDGIFTGSVCRADSSADEARERLAREYSAEEISAMTEYPKEYSILNPLYEFDSIEDLPSALAAASAFVGSK